MIQLLNGAVHKEYVKGNDYDQSLCEASGTDDGSSNDTEYNINWNTTPDDCDFPSKDKCGSDPSNHSIVL